MACKVRVMLVINLLLGFESSKSSSFLVDVDSFEKIDVLLALLRTDTANYYSDYTDLSYSFYIDSDWV